MDFSFKNKTVLITGGARGIGKQLADDFEKLGAVIVLTGNHSENLKEQNRYYYNVDFTDESKLNWFIQIVKEMSVDVFINNAGINKIGSIDEVTEKEWDEIMDINLKAPFLICQSVVNKMKAQYWGRIINIASIFGVVGRDKRLAYITSKTGLIGLARSMAIDLAPYNILVNSVSAGIVDTDMTKKMLSEKEAEEMKKKIPLGRFATTKEISNVVLFLASDMNTYITGQNLIVDGGYVSI